MPQSCKIPFGDFCEIVCVQIPRHLKKGRNKVLKYMNSNRLSFCWFVCFLFNLNCHLSLNQTIKNKWRRFWCSETVQTSSITGTPLVKRGLFESKPTCPNPFLINSLVSTQTDVVDRGSVSATVRNHQQDHSGTPQHSTLEEIILNGLIKYIYVFISLEILCVSLYLKGII